MMGMDAFWMRNEDKDKEVSSEATVCQEERARKKAVPRGRSPRIK
jgi:hypothetical protein